MLHPILIMFVADLFRDCKIIDKAGTDEVFESTRDVRCISLSVTKRTSLCSMSYVLVTSVNFERRTLLLRASLIGEKYNTYDSKWP